MPNSRRAFLILVASLVLWTAATTAAHAAAWLPGPTLSEGAAQPAHAAVRADGRATYLWIDGPPGAQEGDVVSKWIAADGTPGSWMHFGEGAPLGVAASSGGGTFATWTDVSDDGRWLDVGAGVFNAVGVLEVTRTAMVPVGPIAEPPVGAVAPDGAILVAWLEETPVPGEFALLAQRIAADGSPGWLTVDLGPATDDAPSVGIGSDGVARVAWRRPGAVGGGYRVARIAAAGGLDDTAQLTAAADASELTVEVEGGHAVAGWIEPSAGDPELGSLHVARLPSGGPVAEPPTTVVPALRAFVPGFGIALAPDGTATVAYPEATADLGGQAVLARRLSPAGALGAPQQLSTPQEQADLNPVAVPGRDGTTIVAWTRTGLGFVGAAAISRELGADGTPVGGELPLALPRMAGPGAGLTLASGPAGDVVATTLGGRPAAASMRLLTSRLDSTPPALDTTVPATAVRGAEVVFTAYALDPAGIARIDWQFGDGATGRGQAVAHAYAAAGTYAVAATATDNTGYRSTVTRTITVTEPGAQGPGPRGPGPVPRRSPVGRRPPAARKAPARLRITSVARRGASVTVAGALDRRASGRVTVTWAQRSGRRTVRRTQRARIVRSHFATTLSLPRRLARPGAAGRLTVSYGGDADTARASVERVVRAPARRAPRPRR